MLVPSGIHGVDLILVLVLFEYVPEERLQLIFCCCLGQCCTILLGTFLHS